MVCYPKCKAGFSGTGPICFEDCKDGRTACGGVLCLAPGESCGAKVLSTAMQVSTLIVEGVTANPVMGAINVASLASDLTYPFCPEN